MPAREIMKYKTFENYLQDIHANQYEGLDDDMPDDFDNWMSNLDAQEAIDYAERWGKELQKPGWTEAEIESVEESREIRIKNLLEAIKNCSHYDLTCFCPEAAMELGGLGYEFPKPNLTEEEEMPN